MADDPKVCPLEAGEACEGHGRSTGRERCECTISSDRATLGRGCLEADEQVRHRQFDCRTGQREGRGDAEHAAEQLAVAALDMFDGP